MASGYVLGISAFYHDSAACLLAGDVIVAAAQEERFTRIKGDESFPAHAARYCLAEAGVTAADLDAVVFYEKPLLKFERLFETYLNIAPRGLGSFRRAAPLWLKERLYIERDLRSGLGGYTGKILYTEHHEAHAASAFFPSPFDEAAILTIDGVGEWATTSVAVGRGSELEMLKEIHFPHSLGLLYSAFTYYTGFKVNSGEYKLMGLAPYGEPRFSQRILDHLIDLKSDGSFRLDLSYFDYCTGLTMTNGKFSALFDGPVRQGDQPLTQHHMALAAYHLHRGQPRKIPSCWDSMKGSYLGPSFSQREIEERLTAAGACFTAMEREVLLNACTDALIDGKALGWFQG